MSEPPRRQVVRKIISSFSPVLTVTTSVAPKKLLERNAAAARGWIVALDLHSRSTLACVVISFDKLERLLIRSQEPPWLSKSSVASHTPACVDFVGKSLQSFFRASVLVSQ